MQNREIASELLAQIAASANAGDALMLGPQAVMNLHGLLSDLLRAAEPSLAERETATRQIPSARGDIAASGPRNGPAAEPTAPRHVTKEEYNALERAFWQSVEVIDEERCWIKGCTKPKGHRGDCAIFLSKPQEHAMQALADQAQALDMGYGPDTGYVTDRACDSPQGTGTSRGESVSAPRHWTSRLAGVIDDYAVIRQKSAKELVDLALEHLIPSDDTSMLLLHELCSRVNPDWAREELSESRPAEPTCEHDWTTDTCPKCGAKRERGPLPSCGWGPCGILEGVEYHDPHCPSLKEKKRAQNRT